MEWLVAFSALLALVSATHVEVQDTAEYNPAYGYLSKVAVPLAEKIRQAEAQSSTLNKLNNHVQPTLKIVNGAAAKPGQIPYQAGLIVNLKEGPPGVCGGSLLNSKKVLTAAHCWYDGNWQATGYIVVLGSVKLYSGGVRMETSQVVVHKDWNIKNYFNDIAMITLPKPVEFTNLIQPIALPTGNELQETYVGSKVIASGFGRKKTGERFGENTHLSYAELKVIENAQCKRLVSHIIPSKLCARGVNLKSVCHGDSGGPLTVMGKNKLILIGVTSFGPKNCETGLPMSYTRVSSFIEWITSQL